MSSAEQSERIIEDLLSSIESLATTVQALARRVDALETWVYPNREIAREAERLGRLARSKVIASP